MPAILHDLYIAGTAEAVFDAVTTPEGLDAWWTAKSKGIPEIGSEYTFWFAPEYDWRALVTECQAGSLIRWKVTRADEDWEGTILSIQLFPDSGGTKVRFAHDNWVETNDHFRRASYCWAIYLNGLKKYIEAGAIRPFETRSSV